MISTKTNQLMMVIILLTSMIVYSSSSFNLNEANYLVLKENKTSVIKITFSERFDHNH
jgi:hypothetical protein